MLTTEAFAYRLSMKEQLRQSFFFSRKWRLKAYSFIKRRLQNRYFLWFFEIFKNTYFVKHLPMAASITIINRLNNIPVLNTKAVFQMKRYQVNRCTWTWLTKLILTMNSYSREKINTLTQLIEDSFTRGWFNFVLITLTQLYILI